MCQACLELAMRRGRGPWGAAHVEDKGEADSGQRTASRARFTVQGDWNEEPSAADDREAPPSVDDTPGQT